MPVPNDTVAMPAPTRSEVVAWGSGGSSSARAEPAARSETAAIKNPRGRAIGEPYGKPGAARQPAVSIQYPLGMQARPGGAPSTYWRSVPGAPSPVQCVADGQSRSVVQVDEHI